MDVHLPADQKIKLKESEKRDKYHDLAKELKRLWNMKVTVMPIVIIALGTVTNGLVQEMDDFKKIRGRVETVQTTALLRLVKSLSHDETCCYLDSCGIPSDNAGVKNSKKLIQ